MRSNKAFWTANKIALANAKSDRIDLIPREFDLLWALADHAGRVMTHESLLEQVWGPAHRQDLYYLRVAVRLLRRKLEEDPAKPRLVVNEPGLGYRLMR